MEVTENDQDVVILKSDGIPTYHFAHVVDDHLMGTTIVVRGEEWLATLPVHLQLFRAMGWKAPKYAHTAQLMKIDPETGGKRKLSKRKDPELALTFYAQEGLPGPGRARVSDDAPELQLRGVAPRKSGSADERFPVHHQEDERLGRAV